MNDIILKIKWYIIVALSVILICAAVIGCLTAIKAEEKVPVTDGVFVYVYKITDR